MFVGRGRRGEIDFVCVRAFVYCGRGRERERGREKVEDDSLVFAVACTEIYDVGGV
jgi:hypothetical protein